MQYYLTFSYEHVVVPMNAQTTAAIETLFGKSVSYEGTWANSQEGLIEKGREFRIQVMSDTEFKKRLENGLKAAQENN